jgi:hypothetical integral membrane protein (TIGR02206 family)
MIDTATAPADGLELFGVSHTTTLALIGLSALVLSWWLRAVTGRPHEALVHRIVCWGLGIILVGGAIVGQIYRAMTGEWTLAEALPLHLCDIAVFTVAVAVVEIGSQPPARPISTLSQRLYELAYVWGIGGTVQALLTPDMAFDFPNANCIRYFIIHGAIVVGVLVMTFGLRMRPQPGTPRRVWIVTLALALVVMVINGALRAGGVEANYMYLCGPPAHPSLFDLFGPWPWSLISLVFVGTALIVLTYLPFWVQNRIRGYVQPSGPPAPRPADHEHTA